VRREINREHASGITEALLARFFINCSEKPNNFKGITVMMIERVDTQRETICAQVHTILQEICPEALVTDQTDLVEDLGIESVTMMSLILRVEGHFSVILGGREMEAGVLKTAGNLIDFLVSSSDSSRQEQKAMGHL
jgi:acyl carrier protein